MFQIVRIFYKGEVEAHSIEGRDAWREALQRFHAIIAADLSNNEITYSYVAILNEEGHNAIEPFVYNTMPETDGEVMYPFKYAVLRVRIKDGERQNSVEFKTYLEAIKRYFSILAADIDDTELSFNLCTVINGEGEIVEGRGFYH